MWEKRNGYMLFVERPEGKKPLGKSTHRCKDNIKMDFLEIRWGVRDIIGLLQDINKYTDLMNAVMNLRVS
jgi:hypothetical protein